MQKLSRGGTESAWSLDANREYRSDILESENSALIRFQQVSSVNQFYQDFCAGWTTVAIRLQVKLCNQRGLLRRESGVRKAVLPKLDPNSKFGTIPLLEASEATDVTEVIGRGDRI
jgi:hypothetical protein